MQSGIATLIKLILLIILVLVGLAIWLLPKTRLVKQRKINEKLFVVTCIAGVLCGACGLVVIFAWPQYILKGHLYELILMPSVLLYAYWIIIMRRARSMNVIDEKQNFDMANALGWTWVVSIIAMFAAFDLKDTGLFDAGLWFPYYIFVNLLVYSASTLYLFKRS